MWGEPVRHHGLEGVGTLVAMRKGLGNVPSLAGRSPIYLVRQLYDFKHGARAGKEVALMVPVVVGLTQEDMINLAAYISSRQP